jgi:limonene-1,2-epoxide hydrolase
VPPVRSEVQVSETPESVARRFLAGWETAKPELDELVAFFAEDAVFTDGPKSEYRGVQAIREQFQTMTAMLGSLTIHIRTLVVNGNCVMVERVENVEVQGHPFDIPGVVVFEFDDELRIKQLREYFAAMASPAG